MILDSSLSPKFGVEVHARVTSSRLKLMSRSENIDDPENPNLHVDLVDLGMPGALPVLNNETIVRAIRSAIALNMRINESFGSTGSVISILICLLDIRSLSFLGRLESMDI